MATRYVNTGSTAGGDGTTNNTSGSTRAYATLNEALNALSNLTDQTTIYCTGSTDDTVPCVQADLNFTTTAANYLSIIGERSPNHFSPTLGRTWNSSLYTLAITNSNAFYNNDLGHIRIEGLQLEMIVTDSGNEYIGLRQSTANNQNHPTDHRISYCIARKTGAGTSVTYGFFNSDPTGSGGTLKGFNNLAYDLSYGFASDGSTWAQTNCRYLNCTAADCGSGNYANEQRNINCLSQGSAGFVATTASGSSNNASSEGSAVGTNSRIDCVFGFVNSGADDWGLSSSDPDARGFGTVDPESGLYTDDATNFTRGGSWDIGAFEFPLLLEQEGFRWGVDDGSESAHTWEANQDTSISIADTQARLLRVLVNATGDPAATAYTLRAQKNGTGGYTQVNVGATTDITPIIEAGDCTESGNNTAQTSWAVSYPAYVSGDLLIFHVASDANVTHNWPSTGPNGETITTIIDSTGGTAQRASGFYFVGSATTGSGTLTVTPSATEQWTAVVLKVPAGEFYATTPIQATVGSANDTTADADWATPAWTADSRANGKVVCFAAIDTVTTANATSGWTALIQRDRGAVGCSLVCRDAANSASESIGSANIALVSSETDSSFGYVINAPTITNEVYIDASANITAGGEATTARLTAPSGKTTSDFVTGRRWDDENGTDTIDITADDYTEVEWKVALSGTPVDNDYYDFRVYAGATNALDTYMQLPRWTVPAAGGGATVPHKLMMLGVGF